MTITHRNTPSTALAAHSVQNDRSTEGTEIRNAILGNPLQGGEKCREGTSTREKDTAFIQSTLLDPHPQRRKEILQKHPEIQKLFGPSPWTKWVALGLVVLQTSMALLLANTPIISWKFLLTLYIVGATANQALFLAVHEITHNLAFKSINANKALSIFANLPIGMGYAAMFKLYHAEHHKYQGVEGIDTDLPTKFEGKLLQSFWGKLFFLTFQIFFYALRPIIVKPRTTPIYALVNWACVFAFDFVLYKLAGDSFQPIIYLLLSTVMAGSLHPCAAHFISEHYVFDEDYETYSYYGILNWFCFNVGYHNEHHDFPNIAWTNLPALKATAPEFYDHLPRHNSWVLCQFKFLFGDKMSMWCRVKRWRDDLIGVSKSSVESMGPQVLASSAVVQ